MSKKRNGLQRVMDKATAVFERPMTVRPDYSKMIAIDDNDIYIENFKKIIRYTDTEIVFMTAYNKIRIEGEGLFLKLFSEESLIIAGKVCLIGYERVEKL